MKYECPAPSKLGKDLPLWKTATSNFLRIVKECGPQIQALKDGKSSEPYVTLFLIVLADISDSQVESIWRQIVETFRGGILSDW